MLKLTPKILAQASAVLILLSVVVTSIFALLGIQMANAWPAKFLLVAFPLGLFGLMCAGLWFLLGKLITR